MKETKCEMEGILYEKSQNLYCIKSQTFGIFFQKKIGCVLHAMEIRFLHSDDEAQKSSYQVLVVKHP